MFLLQVDTHTDHVLLVQFQAALHLLLQEDTGEELLAHHAVGRRLAVHVALETPTAESVVSFSQKNNCSRISLHAVTEVYMQSSRLHWRLECFAYILMYAAVLLYTSLP